MAEKQKTKSGLEAVQDQIDKLAKLSPPSDFDIKVDGKMTQIDYKWKDMHEKAAFYIHEYKLIPPDLTVMKGQLVIKASGWYKIARQKGYTHDRTAIQLQDLQTHTFIVKAQVFFKGYDEPIQATGMCDMSEPGRDGQTNANLLETAETRAIVRAIKKFCPVSGALCEEDITAQEEQMINRVVDEGKRAEEALGSSKCPECHKKSMKNGKCTNCGITAEEIQKANAEGKKDGN